MKVAILVCAMAGTALADPDPAMKALEHAEQLEKAAHDTGDPEKYVAAGTAYLDLYNANPNVVDADQMLYNAGVAFESGHASGAALQAFTLVTRYHPKSKLAAKALAHLGRLYGDIAMYDRAAEKLEEYAKKYAGEKDAYDAIRDAAYYRKALGDREKVIEDTNYFIKTFGAKQPGAAADAMWSLTAMFEGDPDATLKQLREYVHTFGSKGGTEHLVIAHARIGQLLWKESCSGPMVDGLCVESQMQAKRTCGNGKTLTLVPKTRDAYKLKNALEAFMAASKQYEKQTLDDPSARYYFAQAKLAIADIDLESYLGMEFPKALDFDATDPKKRHSNVRRFDEWLKTKTDAAAKLNAKYEGVLAIKDAASSITAAERMSIITQSFASTMATAEIPRDVLRGPKADDKIKAYCDAMTVVAEPLEARSTQGFAVCLSKSTELGWFDESSRVCERELARLDPLTFPLATELRSQPLQVAPVITSEPPPKFVAKP